MSKFFQIFAFLAAVALAAYVVLNEAIKKVCVNFRLESFPTNQINWQSITPGGQTLNGLLKIGIFNGSRINFKIKNARVFIYYQGQTLMETTKLVNIDAPAYTQSTQNIEFKAYINLMTYQALTSFLLQGDTIAINYKFVGFVWGIPITKKGQINLNPYANLNIAECEQLNQ